jgi:hypothetical protein
MSYTLGFFELSDSLDYDPDPVELSHGESVTVLMREAMAKYGVHTWRFDGDAWESDDKVRFNLSRCEGRFYVHDNFD